MGVTALDQIYSETHSWDDTVAFREGLGFSFAERWGEEGHRAGRMVAGDAALVLAKADDSKEPELAVFLALEGADTFEIGDSVEVEQPLSNTHWGTRWIRVRDPEGRVFCLEEAPG